MLHRNQNPSLKRHTFYTCLILTICLLFGCADNTGNIQIKGKKDNTGENKQALSYTSITIPVNTDSGIQLIYDPVDNVLSQIQLEKHTYTRSSWQPEKGWTTDVEKWKTKKNCTLDNFSYNTDGVLYACQKERKKGKLISQSLVRLQSNGKIKNVTLKDINRLSTSPASNKQIPEITDIQCCGTSIALTYRYGSVKIYNLAEGQALGASNLTGTPGKNVFHDLHYLSIGTQKKNHNILLRDYDIRSGEIIRSFPLGGAGQNTADYYLTNYQNNLYLLTNRGLFDGQCTESTLTLILRHSDLKLPQKSRIKYLQASRNNTLYLGCITDSGDYLLRFITLPESGSHSSDAQNSPRKPAAHVKLNNSYLP